MFYPGIVGGIARMSVVAILAGTGVSAAGEVHANLSAPGLVSHALRRGEGRLSADGAFIAMTGQHTGRSVQDKFVVEEPGGSERIWWEKNPRLEPAAFERLHEDVVACVRMHCAHMKGELTLLAEACRRRLEQTGFTPVACEALRSARLLRKKRARPRRELESSSGIGRGALRCEKARKAL